MTFHRSLSIRLGVAIATLFLAPIAAQAQVGNAVNGSYALYANSTGSYNAVNGFAALYKNTTGWGNAANGYEALYSNTEGTMNSANGFQALYANILGSGNTANGYEALYSNTKGNHNTASGMSALYYNTTGIRNTASGFGALSYNTDGMENTANGFGALLFNTIGYWNTADGSGALLHNTTGSSNIAIGHSAGQLITTGSNNIAIGTDVGYIGHGITTGSNNIDIGNQGLEADSGVIRIGTPGTQQATFIAGINGVTASQGVAVYINANGQLGTLTSSARFKFDINRLGTNSDKLMDLRPVSFRYKEAVADGSHPVQYGLIAEEVAKVYPDMVQYDKQGKPFTVYYQQLTPMMLNELQKAHKDIADLKAEMAELKAAQKQTDKQPASMWMAGLIVISGAGITLWGRRRK